jgi:hypothetical protein
MSEQELKLTQKLFALVERMVKETPVRQLDLDVGKHAHRVFEWDFSFTTTLRDIQWHITTPVTELPFSITTRAIEIMDSFNKPRIVDAVMESLEAHVADVDVAGITCPVIHHFDDQLVLATTCKVNDFFKKFKINEKLLYTTTIHAIELKTITIPIKTIPLSITTTVKENLLLFRRLIIERQPVELSFVTEKEQLLFWRNAVLKTKQEPRYLKLIGVYTGVPYYFIETEKITLNPSRNSLSYRFKFKLPGKMEEDSLKDIALFTLTPPTGAASGTKPSLVMVKK